MVDMTAAYGLTEDCLAVSQYLQILVTQGSFNAQQRPVSRCDRYSTRQASVACCRLVASAAATSQQGCIIDNC